MEKRARENQVSLESDWRAGERATEGGNARALTLSVACTHTRSCFLYLPTLQVVRTYGRKSDRYCHEREFKGVQISVRPVCPTLRRVASAIGFGLAYSAAAYVRRRRWS